MRTVKKSAALVAILSIVGVGALAGCSDTKGAEASTPAGASTAANTAVQTDKDGSTVAPATAAPPAGGDTTAAPPADGDAPKGDVAAGKTFFEGTCQGCHPNGGADAGVGPKLAANANLDATLVTDRVVNGKGAMPGGLASGPDLDNVVAYVLSLQ